MTYTKIDVMNALARAWGGRRALNWSVLVGCPETDCENDPKKRAASICAVNRIGACWAEASSGHNFNQITFTPAKLDDPIQRKKSAIILVSWRSEIADARQEQIDKILDIISQCPQHAFFKLTKKPKLLAEKFRKYVESGKVFPQNLFAGVTVNLQSEIHRVRELDLYLGEFGAYFVFDEPVLGKHEQRAWVDALIDSPSIKIVVIGGWSPELTPDWILKKYPASEDGARAIVGATYEIDLAIHRHIAIAHKENSPLSLADGYKSDFPPVPAWLRAFGMFEPGEEEGEQTTQTETSAESRQGSQASMF